MVIKLVSITILTATLLLGRAAEAQQNTSSEANPAVAEMFSSRTAKTESQFPWHYKTDPAVRFRSATRVIGSAEEKHVRRTFGWQMISRRLLTKESTYPGYIIYLGITDAGMLEGVVFGNVFSSMAGDQAAMDQLSKFQSITISPLGIEGLAEMPMEPIQHASIPGKDLKVWFRKFKPGNRANRMFGGLPDDSEIRMFHTISGKEGSTNYWILKQPKLTAFTIGYLREMALTVRGTK